MKLDYTKIKSLQNKHDLSDREMAKRIGMSNTGYSKMMNKESCSVKTLVNISEAFGKPLLYFFDEEDKNHSKKPKEDVDSCPECIKKQKKITELQEKNSELHEKYSACLEELLGKKGNATANSA